MKTLPGSSLEIFENLTDLSQATADLILSLAKNAVKERGRFSLVLSGGETPKKLYELLATEPYQSNMPWQETHIFWGDERYLPLLDERNNAHAAQLILLDKVPIPEEQVHTIQVNLAPAEAAASYEKEIDVFFANEEKKFDLVLLGLGDNGHTASLFPGTKVLLETHEGIRAVYIEEQQMFRITMTAPLINTSRTIIFMVNGHTKSTIVKDILNPSTHPHSYPATLIKPVNGQLYWFIDQAAAKQLSH